jgi:hypothetical protein
MPAVVGACVLFSEMPPWDRMGCKHTSKYTKNFFRGFGVFILLPILEVRCCRANGKAFEEEPVSIFALDNNVTRN